MKKDNKMHNISRNVFIGLGGTGTKSLIHVKRAIIERYGEVPPSVKFLLFDTDIEMEQITEKIGDKSVKFDNSEQVHIPIKDAAGTSEQDYVQKWLSPQITVTKSGRGAKQTRQVGRLAFTENFGKENILGRITAAIDSVQSQGLVKNENYNIMGDDVLVHLVFSPCGGTGGGTFMDMAMTIKTAFDHHLYAWVVMPEIFKGFAHTANIEENAYASILEIDHMMGKDNAKEPWSNYDENDPFVINPNGNRPLSLAKSGELFKYIYLFDKRMENEQLILDPDEIYDRIGRTLFLHVSDAGDSLKSLYNNNSDYEVASNEKSFFKRRNYSSMGISQLILDRNHIKERKRIAAINYLIKKINHSNKKGISKTCDEFIDVNRLRENNEKDHLIDDLYSIKTNHRYSIETVLPAEFEKGCNVQLKENCYLQLKNAQTNATQACQTKLEELKAAFPDLLQKQLEELYKTPGGLVDEKEFINCLQGSFNGMKKEMIEETSAHGSAIESIRKNLASIMEDQVVEEENSFMPFGKASRIKNACIDYANIFENLIVNEIEKIRKVFAEEFYVYSIALLSKELDSNSLFDSLLNEINQTQYSNLQDIINNRTNKNSRVFEVFIHDYLSELDFVDDKKFGKTSAFQEIDFFSLKKSTSKDQILNKINEYLNNSNYLKSVDNINLESLLQNLPNDKRTKIIEMLDETSAVCINHSDTFTGGTGQEVTPMGAILVDDLSKSIFKAENDIISKLSQKDGLIFNKTLKVYSSYDSDRITFLKIRGMFPANSIHNMRSLAAKFKLSRKYHFSDVYFEKNCLDLFEGKPDGELLKDFAIGSALEIINFKNQRIQFFKANGTSTDMVKTSKGKTLRSLAFKEFCENQDWQNEVRKIRDEISDLIDGRGILYDKFKWHFDNLGEVGVLGKKLESIDSDSDEYHHIFIEKEAIRLAAFGEKFEDAEKWGKKYS
jgi:hypothetical protein